MINIEAQPVEGEVNLPSSPDHQEEDPQELISQFYQSAQAGTMTEKDMLLKLLALRFKERIPTMDLITGFKEKCGEEKDDQRKMNFEDFLNLVTTVGSFSLEDQELKNLPPKVQEIVTSMDFDDFRRLALAQSREEKKRIH